MPDPHSLPRRVTVVAPDARVDVALPADATVAELVPQLATLLRVPADPATPSDGWVLSRLGADPFDADRTVAATGVADGELLYLVPRSRRMQAAVFDDIIDALAEANDELPGAWSPRAVRWTAIGAAVVALLAAVAVLLAAGPPWGRVAGPAGLLALLLVAGAGLLSRVVGDSRLGATAGAGALTLATVAGGAALGGDAALTRLPGTSLLGAAAAVTVLATVLAMLVADAVAAFTGVAFAAAVTAVMTAVQLVFDASPAGVASTAAAVLTAAWAALPALALRLARVPLPLVPADLEDFRTPAPSTAEREVERRAAATSRYLSALQAAFSVVQVGNTLVLARSGSGWQLALAGCVCAALVLRARGPIRGSGPRVSMIAGAVTGALIMVTVVTARSGLTGRVWIAAGLVVVAGAAVAAAVLAPGRRPSPYWGRAFDVLEFLALAAVFPLAAQVTGLLARARGYGG